MVNLVSQHTELKGSGSQYMGLCPFVGHQESTPSFSVSQEKQVYHCFGCGQSGNLLSFYQAMSGVSFAQAVEDLAYKAGLPLPQNTRAKKINKAHQNMWDINAFAAKFYATELKQLKSSHPARQYCQQRRLSLPLCEHFQIGYAPLYDNPLTRALEKNNFSLQESLKLGLIKCRTPDAPKWGECYDSYRGRLMFPIRSRSQHFIGFGGRRLEDLKTKSRGPKYLNSCESAAFSKRDTLYGLYESAKFIRKARVSVVVEGYMDLLALFGQGITNVVATLGTSLTPAHARTLTQLAEQTVVLFDGDEAGQLAAERSLPILLEAGLQARAVFLPSHLDPDDYIQHHGVQSLLKKLHAAPALFNLVLDKHMQGFQHRSDEVIQILDTLGPAVQCTRDPRLRELYVQELAVRLGQKEQWLQRHLPKLSRSKKTVESSSSTTSGPALPETGVPAAAVSAPSAPADRLSDEAARPLISLHKASALELQLLELVFCDVRHLKGLTPDLVAQVYSPGVRQIIELAGEQVAGGQSAYPPRFLSQLLSQVQPLSALGPILNGEVNKELGKSTKSMQSESYEAQLRVLADCVQRVRKAHQERQINRDISALKGSQLQPAEVELKLKEIMQRLKNKHHPKPKDGAVATNLQEA